MLLQIYFKFRLSKAVLIAFCGLISILLKLIAHPLYEIFPTTLKGLYKTIGVTHMDMVIYTVCPNNKCNKLYSSIDAETSITCANVIFGKPCGHKLGYQRSLAFSRTKRMPYKKYHFLPPSTWLKYMFKDPQFCKFIDSSKQGFESPGDVLKDVHDGNIWKTFVIDQSTSEPFFLTSNNIGLLLNIDWFKPFKRSEYKVSAIMISVLNLPRQERCKTKWTMIVGVIPGPSEPKGNINTFLAPLVDDLLLLKDGLDLLPNGGNVKAALLGLSADMPALRKVAQFLGHKADLGCSRCTFKAEREPGKQGASGKMSYYTRLYAPQRTKAQTLIQAKEYQSAESLTQAQNIQRKNGVRYSELLRLPYFDIVRMTITDPMHTFLLGMVQNETKLCLSSLSGTKLSEFYKRLKNIKVPYDMGRLPNNINISEGLSGLTAQQWKNFACIYARPCLSGLISANAYKSYWSTV